MPKERRAMENRPRDSPYRPSLYPSNSQDNSLTRASLRSASELKEWDEVRCSACLEHPHNAILLSCSNYNNGCRPFMCDTSIRHSNCFDQYRKSFSGSAQLTPNETELELSCPLCRGRVSGWKVVGPARRYMNAKARSCSVEHCGFYGTYKELRKHARKEHTLERPSEGDPRRWQEWERMQVQEHEDLLSSLISSPVEYVLGPIPQHQPVQLTEVDPWRRQDWEMIRVQQERDDRLSSVLMEPLEYVNGPMPRLTGFLRPQHQSVQPTPSMMQLQEYGDLLSPPVVIDEFGYVPRAMNAPLPQHHPFQLTASMMQVQQEYGYPPSPPVVIDPFGYSPITMNIPIPQFRPVQLTASMVQVQQGYEDLSSPPVVIDQFGYAPITVNIYTTISVSTFSAGGIFDTGEGGFADGIFDGAD